MSDFSEYDEEKAVAEIKAFSNDARSHLQHVFRNDLQSISSALEMKQYDTARDMVFQISNNLRRMGL